ncbi:MAG: YchJ family protein [Pseudomonadota bacterium]
MMENCPCGMEKPYEECCGPFVKGEALPQTPEALMRSRYSAFTKVEVGYILNTVHPDKREQHHEKTIQNWAKNSEWIDLKILNTEKGGPEDTEGQVEFVVQYYQKGKRKTHHELAQFKKLEDKWYFYDGEAPQQEQIVRTSPKVGRNDSCPCNSGKKYKKCCGR